MEFKKEFTPSVQVDFSKIHFFEIPFPFFAEWLYLVLEISRIIQPGFYVDIPKKQLDWYNFPDREVLDFASDTTYILRTKSLLLEHGNYSIHVLAQHGYEPIPGQYILVKPNLHTGSILARNFMRHTTINFEINTEEAQRAAIEEVFYIFQ